MTRTDAFDQALREWVERQAAGGQEAQLVAPVLEGIVQRQLQFVEDRLVKLMVKNGILSTTAVELFLEQRRRNDHDTTALLKGIRDRVFRRWKDPRNFADTEPDPTAWRDKGKQDEEGEQA